MAWPSAICKRMRPRRSARPRVRQQGISYLWILLAVAFIGAGAGAVGEVWHTAVVRDKEAELLFVGHQFRLAIGRYYAASAGVRTYPQSFEQLIADTRFPEVRRHLRRLYADPLTGKPEWGVVRGEGGGIVGVYSLAPGVPLKTAGFSPGDESFENASSYGQWLFVHRPPSGTERSGSTVAYGTDAGTAKPTAVPPGGGPGVMGMPLTPSRASSDAVAPAPSSPAFDPAARDRVCDVLQRNDAATCAAARRHYGDSSGAQCDASATQRQEACRSGGVVFGLNYAATRESRAR